MNEEQLNNFIRLLYRKNPKKANSFVKGVNVIHKQEEISFDPEQDFVDIVKDDLWRADKVMPKSASLAYGEGYSYGEDHNYWIDFKAGMEGEVRNGNVVLREFKAADVTASTDECL